MADTDLTRLSSPSQADHTPTLVGYALVIIRHHQYQFVVVHEEIYDGVLNSVPALSEEAFMEHLKSKTYAATPKRVDEEPDLCVICQGEYENDELIGGLQCRHEYHVECIKKWLQQNNRCPICKAAAVSMNEDKS